MIGNGLQSRQGYSSLSPLGSRALGSLIEGLKTPSGESLHHPEYPEISDKQLEIINSPARFKVINGGRRGGKTRTAIYGMCQDLAAGLPIWYSALTYKNVEEVWREMMRRVRDVPGVKISKSLKEIEMPNGGRLNVRSLQEYDNLRGSGLARHYIDEFAYVHPDAWPLVLEPMLLERKGGAWFMSSPHGMNHFAVLWQRAQNDPDYAPFKLTAYDNPIVDPSEMDRMRYTTAERVWLQEYLGEFLADGGAVFRNVRQCATAERVESAQPGHQYVIGVDLAKTNDFTVFAVIDTVTRALVYLDRFSQIDYTLQLERLKALSARFAPISIVVERNIGEMFIEQAHRAALPVIPFYTNNASKQKLIEGLSMAFEQSAISIIPDETLIGELQAYEMDKTPSGMLRFGAPEGMHDDTVIALGLAWQYGAMIGGVVSSVK